MKYFWPKIIIALCVLSVVGGFLYRLGVQVASEKLKPYYVNAIKQIFKERDSLHVLLDQSVEREQRYILKIERDSIKSAMMEISIEMRERKMRTYAQRLNEIDKIRIAQPDSFLINRYEYGPR